MKLQEQQAKFAQDVAKLLVYIAQHNHSVTFAEAYRPKETAELYAKDGRGIANSLHCQRLAIDLNLFDDRGNYLTKTEDHKPFGIYWESLDKQNKWGGKFRPKVDGNHYQRTPFTE